ncbi:MAG: aldehyde dehydrogenase family protein [Chloroflexota bacterium]|nr:aldehyde dehydrogenase family protein [Chloroflexota bacterium]
MTLTNKPESRPVPASWGLAAGESPWEYAPAPESTDHVQIRREYGLFVGNRFSAARPRKTFEVINPATEEPLARVARASKADVDRAVTTARRAYESVWSRLPGRERAKYLYRIARILQERSREFAVVETMNSGKPIKESRDVDVPLAAAHFFYYAGWADKLEYAFPNRAPRALGVAAQIIPWNFPLLMLAWKIAPALAAGNTVILKPASTTPLTAYLFANVVRQADLPPGVVNIITGPGEIGMELVRHPGVNKVAFTGSTAVGKMIGRAVAGSTKKLTLELGGKAANIVFDDAPLDQAIEGIINGIYFNQGEVCCAGSRLFVQESVYEPLLDKLKARLGTLRVGDPLDKNTDVGAINSAGQLAKVRELVDSGIAEGAEIFQPDCELPSRGYFFRPTLFTGVSQSHRIAQEEIFGPVLSVLTFRTPEEAVEKANNTPYGLSAGVWTEKGSRIFKMVNAMRAGVVWANTFNRFDPTSPFGGYKESGYGREGGQHGLAAYLDTAG